MSDSYVGFDSLAFKCIKQEEPMEGVKAVDVLTVIASLGRVNFFNFISSVR